MKTLDSILIAVFLATGLSAAWAQPVPPLSVSTPAEPLEHEYFYGGLKEAGAWAGLGLGTRIFGGDRGHDLALGGLHYGYVLHRTHAAGKWYESKLEVLGEFFGGSQFDPESAYFVGAAPFIRYNLTRLNNWVPFIEAGAGIGATDIGPPALGTVFEFNLAAGAGLRYFLNKQTALFAGFRYLHISNARIEPPDLGVNLSVFRAGLSWYF